MIEKCPKCESTQLKRLTYTWWGGLLGPKLIPTTQCQACKAQFNSKTGKPNTRAIVLYYIGVFLVAFLVAYLVLSM